MVIMPVAHRLTRGAAAGKAGPDPTFRTHPGRCAISSRAPLNRRWLPLNALRAFEAVGQRLSFTAGANALGVTQSAVSRHVIGLEEMLGRALLERDSTGLSLTPAGSELLPVVTKSFERIEQTLNAIRDNSLPGRAMRLQVPPSLLQLVFMPVLAEFHRDNPDIRIDVSSVHVTGLPQTDIDMAIVYDRPNVDDRITDLLWMVRVAPMCSPATAEAASGKSLAAFLASQELLHMKLDNQPRDLLWGAYLRQMGINLPTENGLAFDTSIALAVYAMTSGGVFLGEVDMFRQELAQGRLTVPYDAAIEDGFGYYLKLHPDDLADPAISTFRSWLIARFAAFRGESVVGVRH